MLFKHVFKEGGFVKWKKMNLLHFVNVVVAMGLF